MRLIQFPLRRPAGRTGRRLESYIRYAPPPPLLPLPRLRGSLRLPSSCIAPPSFPRLPQFQSRGHLSSAWTTPCWSRLCAPDFYYCGCVRVWGETRSVYGHPHSIWRAPAAASRVFLFVVSLRTARRKSRCEEGWLRCLQVPTTRSNERQIQTT